MSSSTSKQGNNNNGGDDSAVFNFSFSSLLPPILNPTVDVKKYPEMVGITPPVAPFPGGALIEFEMMKCARYTCTAAFIYSPIQWLRARRRILKPELKSTVPFKSKLQSNMAYGFAAGLLSGLAKGTLENVHLSEREVVDQAVAYRNDRERMRWSTTLARLGCVCVVWMVMFAQGSLPSRVASGYAAGVLLSMPMSATELDFALGAAMPF